MFPVHFYTYWVSDSIRALTNVLYIMVVITFIYQETGSVTSAALVPLFSIAAKLLSGFLTPLLVERFRFQTLTYQLGAYKFVLLLILTFFYSVLQTHLIWLFAMVLLISIAAGFSSPLLSSMVPKVVKEEKLAKANSLLSFTSQTVSVAGYTFTGFLVVVFGGFPVLVGMCVLELIALVTLFFTLKSLRDQPEVQSSSNKWDAIQEGWTIIWRNPSIRIITVVDIIEGIAGAIWTGAVTLAFVQEILHKSEAWWGYINASYYIGTILGGLLAVRLAQFIQNNLIKSMALGSLFFSVLTLYYGFNEIPMVALMICVFLGPSYQIRDIAQKTALQRSTDPEKLPKVYAIHGMLTSSALTMSIAMVGLVADLIGVQWVYFIGGGLILCSVFLSFLLLSTKKRVGYVKTSPYI